MKDNVVPLSAPFYGNIAPDQILDGNKGKLEQVILIGWDKDGSYAFASSCPDLRDMLVLLHKAGMVMDELARDA